MPKQAVQIEGLKELEAALKELPKATGKNTIRRALIAAAQPMLQEAQRLIRVRRVKPAIINTKVKFTSGNAGKQAFAAALASGATRQEAGQAAREANAEAANEADVTSGLLSIGPTKRAFYGFEYGTSRQAPAPFMRPAWEKNKLEAAQRIRDLLREEIDKAAARIAKKMLRK